MNSLDVTHPFLTKLERDERNQLLLNARLIRRRPGRSVQESGKSRSPVIFLLKGTVRCRLLGTDNREMLSRLYQGPALIGDIEALAGIPTLEAATSVDYVEALLVGRRQFCQVIGWSAAFSECVVRDLAKRMTGSLEALRSMSFTTVEGRLGEIMLDYAALGGRPKSANARLDVPITQTSLSKDLGVGRTIVNHALRALREDNLVKKTKARYELPNLKALRGRVDRETRLVHRSVVRRRKAKQDEIRIIMPIPVVEAGQAPFYAAQAFGYYEKLGLRVRFVLPDTGMSPIDAVSDGSADIAVIGGPEALVIARAAGKSVRAIGVMHRHSNFPCLLTVSSSGLTELSQLEERRVGFYYEHISTPILKLLLKKENIRVEEVDVGFDYLPLRSGHIDAQWAFRVTAGIELPAMGISINIIQPSDYGIATHGYTIFTSDSYIDQNPEIVRRFSKATLAGIKSVVDHPDDVEKSPAGSRPHAERRYQPTATIYVRA